jgi:hypothetical protein
MQREGFDMNGWKTWGLLTAVAVWQLASTPASATELWDAHLRGVDEGLAAGASPPPGVYGILNNYWASFDMMDASGHKNGVKLDALVEVPIVLWQTGYTVFGANLSAAIAQPFDYTNLRIAGDAAVSNNAHWGTYNTLIIPFQLSWALPDDFHVATNLTVLVDDASSAPGRAPAGGGVGSGNGYWTLEPTLGVSWLHDGWNLSMNLHYDYNFRNDKTDYRSGQQIAIDYTATKTLGKWIVGVGAHQENQLNDDSGAGAVAAGCPSKNGCKVANYGIGPLVGYQFGGVEILAEYNHGLYTENDVGGNIFNLRLVSALY